MVAAGSKEEGCGVPSVLQSKTNLLTSGLALCNDGRQVLHVLVGQDGLVVVHEVAVIRGQGECVHLASDLRSGDGAGVVSSFQSGSHIALQRGQALSLHQASQLVLCEAVDVGSGSDVSDDLGASVSLGNAFDLGVDHDAGVSVHESLDLSLEQIRNAFLLGDPHGDIVSTCQGVGDFAAVVGGVLGIVSGVGLATSSEQAQAHNQSQNQANDSLHNLPPIFPLCGNNDPS